MIHSIVCIKVEENAHIYNIFARWFQYKTDAVHEQGKALYVYVWRKIDRSVQLRTGSNMQLRAATSRQGSATSERRRGIVMETSTQASKVNNNSHNNNNKSLWESSALALETQHVRMVQMSFQIIRFHTFFIDYWPGYKHFPQLRVGNSTVPKLSVMCKCECKAIWWRRHLHFLFYFVVYNC